MRVLVLGTSHAATLRRAFGDFVQSLTEADKDRAPPPAPMDLQFWGLPGAAFLKAAIGPDGLLRPDPADPVGLRKSTEWNGSAALDLAGFDRIWLVGLRHGLRPVLQIMRALQPYDWGKRAGTRSGVQGVSLGFLRAAIRAEVDAGLSAQAARIPFDARMTALPAPYPAKMVTATGAQAGSLGEPVTRAVAQLERAADLMALYEDEVAAAHAAHGLGHLPQPRETLAAPFLTDDRYVDDPAQDARHMNSAYGLIALKALKAASDARPNTPNRPD